MKTTITSKGQVTIPVAIREAFGLKNGDVLEFIEDGNEIRVRPLRRERASNLRGLIQTKVPHAGPEAEREAVAAGFAREQRQS
jgi:antitoxin PrlF